MILCPKCDGEAEEFVAANRKGVTCLQCGAHFDEKGQEIDGHGKVVNGI
jgi:hypothetical protein